jgi:hypothetical protein
MVLSLGVVRAVAADKGSTYAELDPARIATIASWLPETPTGFGKPITDRNFWTSTDTLARTDDCVNEAQRLLGQPFPAWDDNLYLDYSRTGQRPPGEKMMSARTAWLRPLVLAECVENGPHPIY